MTTPYRDTFAALSAREAALRDELSAVQAEARALGELQKTEARIQGELDALQKKLEGMATRRSLPLLDRVQIASPCTASWEAMRGDDQVRFCDHCEKNVYNLSGMAKGDAEQLLRDRSGDLCVRVYQRQDGTVLTADCPVGVKRKRRRRIAAAAVGGGLAAAGALLSLATRATMGKMAQPMQQEEIVMGRMEAISDPPVVPQVEAPPARLPAGTPRMGKMMPREQLPQPTQPRR